MPKRKCYGVGENDMPHIPRKGSKEYQLWHSVLTRSLRRKTHDEKPTYRDASVCEEWLKFSNFYEWLSKNYVEGYVLDKDVLLPGNKHYGPETCVFIPVWVNTLFSNVKNETKRALPLGVAKVKNKFFGRFAGISAGPYESPEDAHAAYQLIRCFEILKRVEKYKSLENFDPRVAKAIEQLAYST